MAGAFLPIRPPSAPSVLWEIKGLDLKTGVSELFMFNMEICFWYKPLVSSRSGLLASGCCGEKICLHV